MGPLTHYELARLALVCDQNWSDGATMDSCTEIGTCSDSVIFGGRMHKISLKID